MSTRPWDMYSLIPKVIFWEDRPTSLRNPSLFNPLRGWVLKNHKTHLFEFLTGNYRFLRLNSKKIIKISYLTHLEMEFRKILKCLVYVFNFKMTYFALFTCVRGWLHKTNLATRTCFSMHIDVYFPYLLIWEIERITNTNTNSQLKHYENDYKNLYLAQSSNVSFQLSV